MLEVLPVAAPADDLGGPVQGQWTYADYAALPNNGHRYEIIHGVLYMAPAPGTAHQSVTGLIYHYLLVHVQFSGRGRVFSAPIDVELRPHNVFQPDVVVVLNAHLNIITATHLVGVPDLVVEVASPSTAGYDRREKQDAYAQAGVPEYWIADPAACTVELLRLQGEGYRSLGVFQGQAHLPSLVAPSLPVAVAEFFAF